VKLNKTITISTKSLNMNMAKYLILFLIVFVFILREREGLDDFFLYHYRIYRNCISYEICHVQNIYYQALLKKWQASADWKEYDPINGVAQIAHMCSSEVSNIALKIINEYYSIGMSELKNNPAMVEYAIVGERKEYVLVRVTTNSMSRMIWLLISKTSKELLSAELYHFYGSLYLNYVLLLDELNSSSVEQRQLWSSYNKNIHENIDSTAAIAIAVAAAIEHYDFDMLPIMASLMGIYREHWMVYNFPVVDTISHETHEYCYRYAYFMHTINDIPDGIRDRPNCPKAVLVLISRENGQILSMAEEFIFPQDRSFIWWGKWAY
jgi:hypothetical protein